MKKVITNEAIISELCKVRKTQAQLKLLMETAIQNHHNIMRLIDPPQRIPVREENDFDKIWDTPNVNKQIWKINTEMMNNNEYKRQRKEEPEDVFIGILKTINPNK